MKQATPTMMPTPSRVPRIRPVILRRAAKSGSATAGAKIASETAPPTPNTETTDRMILKTWRSGMGRFMVLPGQIGAGAVVSHPLRDDLAAVDHDEGAGHHGAHPQVHLSPLDQGLDCLARGLERIDVVDRLVDLVELPGLV